MMIWNKNVKRSVKWDIWGSRYSRPWKVYLVTNGHKMENLIHGGSTINLLVTKWKVGMELDNN